MNQKIRVLQYGVGPIGARIVRLMLQKPALQIVGAVDVDPLKVGRDLGEVAGAGHSLGVVVRSDARPLLQAGVDIIRIRHPRAAATVKNFINQVCQNNKS